MQKLIAQHPHVVRRFLEDMLEHPVEVDWDTTPRLAWPRTEVYVAGASYQPARPDPETLNAKLKKWLPADELWASPAELRVLFGENKIEVGHPHADVGRVTGSVELAFRPWPESAVPKKPAEPFDETLIWARLLKNVQLCAGIKLQVGEVFVTTYQTVYPLSISLPPVVEILRR